jgi:hypothetical protein
MNDIVNNLKLIPIDSVSLLESGVGENINERFSNIDKNFQTIINSEYLKGQTGDGIYAKECLFEKDSGAGLGIYKSDQSQELTSGELYELISNRILTGVEYSNPLSNERIPRGKIVLIYQNKGDKNILISSLPYVFIDKVYLGSLRVENKPNPNKDLSCIVYFENDNFVKSSTIPKIYYNDDVAAFCWDINGVPTQLPAQGPKGVDGKPGVSVYYAKCEYVNGNYKLTHIYEQGNFISLEDPNSDTDISLENGTIVMAYYEINVVDSNEKKVDIIVGVVNKDDESGINIIAQPVLLNIPSISELMKKNDSNSLYVTIPNTNELYHKISSINIGADYVLKMGVVEENPDNFNVIEPIENDVLISEYSRNEFNGKLIADNEENEVCASRLSTLSTFSTDGDNIKIEVGGKTSVPFKVPYAVKATELTDTPTIQNTDDNKVTITAGGKTSQPLALHADNSDKLGEKLHNYYTALAPTAILEAGDNPIMLQNGQMVYVKHKSNNFGDDSKLRIHFDISNHTGSPTVPTLPDISGEVMDDPTYMTILQCSINIPAGIKISQIKCYNRIQSSEEPVTYELIEAKVYTPAIDSTDWADTTVQANDTRREIIWTGYKYKDSTKDVVDWYQSHILYKCDPTLE